MTHRPGPRQRISRDELDRLFDRELDSCERRDLVGRLARDPEALDEVNDVRGIVNTMRLRPGETPDLTHAVLDRLDDERGFLSPRSRRRVKAGRLAVAATVLLGLLGVSIAHRVAPERFRLHEQPTPVADLGNAVRDDSIEGRRTLAAAVQEFASSTKETAAARFAEGRFAADHAGTAAFGSPRDVSASLDLPVSPPARFLTLAVSADAESAALSVGSTLVVSEVMFSSVDSALIAGPVDTPVFELPGFAFAVTGPEVFETPAASGIAEIRAGVLPLSFGGPTRAAIVGRRPLFPERIEHAPETTFPDMR